MPAIRNYTVEQIRIVEVAAENAADAAKLASVAFEYGQNQDGSIVVTNDSAPKIHGVPGNTTTRIKETGLHVDVSY